MPLVRNLLTHVLSLASSKCSYETLTFLHPFRISGLMLPHYLLHFFAALLCAVYNGIVDCKMPYVYIYYDMGMMDEISFARFSCIIFLAPSISSLFANAHIALTVAVSEIISDRGITPISSKSLPVS